MQKYLLSAALFTILPFHPASAQDFRVGAIEIRQPWSPAAPSAAKAAGGYLTITNTGTTPDTLLGGSIEFAGRLEVHEMSMDGGIMRMRELKPGLVVKPGETVTLKPGGLHLMFMEVKKQPSVGSTAKGTLEFEKAGKVAIEFKIEPFGTRQFGDGGAAKKGNMGVEKGSGSGSGSGSGIR